MHYLSLCLIAKDEEWAIREWVAHHALVGVEHFYIIDNDSRTPISRVLRDFPRQLFTFSHISGPEKQMLAYSQCLQEHGSESRWIGFIDTDEFLFPLQGKDLRPVLAEFEPYAGLAVPWTMFGSSGHLARPKGLMMESYLHRYPDHATGWHQVIKCLVDPTRIQGVHDPHCFAPTAGEHLVNEAHMPLPPKGKRTLRSIRKLQLNHYFFKSRQEWEEKLARGRADRADAQARYPATLFDQQTREATRLDKSILRFLPGVHAALANPASLAPPESASLPLQVAVERVLAALQTGQLEQAHIYLCQAAGAQPQASELWLLRAMLCRLAGQYEQAAFFIRQALEREESPEIYLELVSLAHAQGRREDAQAALLCLDNIVWHQQAQAEWQPRQNEARRLIAAMG